VTKTLNCSLFPVPCSLSSPVNLDANQLTINYSEELIKMYLHDDILQESVTYQRILNEGVTKGFGLGEKSEAIALISRQLKKRFGEVSETIKPRLQTLSIEQLELFGESLFDFESFEDAIAWLNNLN
jgi:predicted transposase YdaD